MKKALSRISIFMAFVLPFFIMGACDTDDITIEGKWIDLDSTLVYIDSLGTANTMIVSSLSPWKVEFEYAKDAEWLTVSPAEGDRTSVITFTSGGNGLRRREAVLWFGFVDDPRVRMEVEVIQRARAHYEPGSVILSDNMGSTEIGSRTAVSYVTTSTWGKFGSGSSTAGYSGTDAYLQSSVVSTEVKDGKTVGLYKDASGGNSLELEPGGVFQVSRVNIGSSRELILTMYVNAGGVSTADALKDIITLEGSTDNNEYFPLSFVTDEFFEYKGWQRIWAEFSTVSTTYLYLRIGNTGSGTVYIDDLLLEAAGREGVNTIGTPMPGVTTLAAEDVTATSATLRGRYTLPGEISAVDRAGIRYWLEGDDDNPTAQTVADTEPSTVFTLGITGTEGEVYNYQAFVFYQETFIYGDILTVELQGEPDEGDE